MSGNSERIVSVCPQCSCEYAAEDKFWEALDRRFRRILYVNSLKYIESFGNIDLLGRINIARDASGLFEESEDIIRVIINFRCAGCYTTIRSTSKLGKELTTYITVYWDDRSNS